MIGTFPGPFPTPTTRRRRVGRGFASHPPIRMNTLLRLSLLLGIAALAACGPRPIIKCRESGEFNFRHQRYELAADDFADIIERAPGDANAQARYGQCMLELGDLNSARRSLEVASAALPNDEEVTFALADCYFKQGDQTRLYQLLRERAEATGSTEIWVRMSDYALRFNDMDMANTAALAAIEVDNGRSAVPYYQSALVHERLDQTGEALRRLRQAYGINPDDTRVRTKLVELGEVPGPTLALPPGK